MWRHWPSLKVDMVEECNLCKLQEPVMTFASLSSKYRPDCLGSDEHRLYFPEVSQMITIPNLWYLDSFLLYIDNKKKFITFDTLNKLKPAIGFLVSRRMHKRRNHRSSCRLLDNLLSIDNVDVESCCRIIPDSHPGVIALKLFPGLQSSKSDLAVMENGRCRSWKIRRD